MNQEIIIREFIRLSSDEFNKAYIRLSRSAERLSVYSDSSLILKTPKGSQIIMVFDLLALCWILPYTSLNTIESEVRAAYYNQAISFPDGQYSDLLRRVSSLRQWNLNDIVREIVKEIGTEAFFGILNQYLKDKRVNQFRIKRGPSHEWTPKHLVRRGQRKRGYTDKGHLPDPKKRKWVNVIHQEEAKEEIHREKPEFLDFIKPRRWGRR